MSTSTLPTTTTTTTDAAGGGAGRHEADRRSSRAVKITAFTAVGVAAAGAITGLVIALSGSGATADTTPTVDPTVTHSTSYGPASNGSHAVTPVKPVTPVAPSAAIETLQKDLGQLNYYEGPVTGVMNAQTTHAITYLQRDAHLPQTGTMNAATQAALANFLANGNNQMGS